MLKKISWRNYDTQRYYNLHLQEDMFCDWSLTASWGSIQTRLGNTKTKVFMTLGDALKEVDAIEKKRKSRGYTKL